MENILIGFIIFLSLILLFLLGAILYFLKKIVESNSKKSLNAEINKEEYSEFSSQSCVDHPERPAVGICSLSDEPYCELCLAKENDLKFARKYTNLVLDSQWDDLFVLANEEVDQSKINHFYDFKREKWNQDSLPIIAQKQYKINIENDKIEMYTIIKCRVEDKYSLTHELNFLNPS